MKIINFKSVSKPTIYSLLIILTLIFNYVSIVVAQNKTEEPKLTEAERKEAEEIAVRFALRFSQTKDLTPLIKEFFRDDVIEIYRKGTLEDAKEGNTDISIISGLSADGKLLKSLDLDDWKKLYISTNNFMMSWVFVFTIRNAGEIKNEEDDIDLTTLDGMYSAKLKTIFDKNPNLNDVIEYHGKSKPLHSIEEFRTALEVLDQGTKIFNEEHPVLMSEKMARQIFKKNEESEHNKMRVTIAEDDFPLIQKGTRLIGVRSPIDYGLILAKRENKLKVIIGLWYSD